MVKRVFKKTLRYVPASDGHGSVVYVPRHVYAAVPVYPVGNRNYYNVNAALKAARKMVWCQQLYGTLKSAIRRAIIRHMVDPQSPILIPNPQSH